jgi:hypothetical protein
VCTPTSAAGHSARATVEFLVPGSYVSSILAIINKESCVVETAAWSEIPSACFHLTIDIITCSDLSYSASMGQEIYYTTFASFSSFGLSFCKCTATLLVIAADTSGMNSAAITASAVNARET